MQHSHHHFYIGIGYILLTWLVTTLMSPLIRLVSKDLSLINILFVQGLVGMIIIAPWMIKHGKESLRTKNWGLVLLRSGCTFLAGFLTYVLILHTSLVDSFLFGNSSPIFLPIVVFLWFKIPPDTRLWPALIGGFLGIILILKPGAEIFNVVSLCGIVVGVLGAIVMIALRLLSRTTRNHTVLFYFFFFSTVAALPFVIMSGQIPSKIDWILLAIIGVMYFLSQLFIAKAFHHASPVILGPFNYSSILFAGLLDWLLYGVRPSMLSWIGIALVCLSGIWMIRHAKIAVPGTISNK